MDPAEITQIQNAITHQGELLLRQQEQLSQISETLWTLTDFVQPRPNPNPGGANAQVSSPSATGVAIVPPGKLSGNPRSQPPSSMTATLEDVQALNGRSIGSGQVEYQTKLILLQYVDLREAFSKRQSATLPPHRPYYCTIELLPGSTPPQGRLYSLLTPEAAVMDNYIRESLEAESNGITERANQELEKFLCCVSSHPGEQLDQVPRLGKYAQNTLPNSSTRPFEYRSGALRGETDFAKGGVVRRGVGRALGKNDGAVAGTRYFQCPPRFGLFAPIHKVIRIGFPSTSPAKAKKSKRMAMGVSSLAHSPSSSSISSVSSVASSVGGRPSRTGLLTETSSRYARKISGTTALQEALKEKQQHIEQLLAERDLERAEVAKATSHICEVEKELSVLKAQHLQYVTETESNLQQVKTLLASTQKDKVELANQLEEEKRKVEDLQFRVEEESITKGDLETQTKLEHARFRQLEQNLFLEKSRAEKLQKELEQSTVEEQSRVMQLEDELALRRAEIEELQVRLRDAAKDGDSTQGPVAQSETILLREQLLTAGREHHKESSQLREKYEAAVATGQKETDKLKATVDKQSQEIIELKQKVQQASTENMEMMDNWKVKLDTLVNDHQRSLEDLKASLSSGSAKGQQQEPHELRTTLESLRMEHQLELENLKARHEIEAALLAKERDDLRSRLQDAKDQLVENTQNWNSQAQTKARSDQQALELREVWEKFQKAQLRVGELERLQGEQDGARDKLQERLELAEKKMVDYKALQKAEAQSRQELYSLEEKLRVTENRLQAVQDDHHMPQDANVIENNDILEEKIKLKQNVEETMENLTKREREVSTLTSHVDALKSQITALEGKVRLGEKKGDALVKEKMRLEADLECMTKKSHDASGQLVVISQELLKKERSLNELRVLLLDSPRHSPGLDRDLSREVHKAEWRVKEQKLQDDIKTLRDKLLLLGRERGSSPDHRRYSMLDPSTLDSEVTLLRQRLMSTEEALRGALEHNQEVDQLVQAMRTHPDKSEVHGGANSANGIHQQNLSFTQDEQH
ncbi:CAP-Gly domain-containing linker protein 2-like [Oncorhynchus kisutch]|uniref:CAP-Gly domain-containing linker protein 2-like n=1 Tax=Oncorhynchus kisutch TaxID=8019 RepID=UPI0012DD9EBA|nr:CAP-Gly domain-containing linker protein 2-like [Oncorhynchus kisutch]